MMIQCPYCGNIEENRGICSACGKIMIKEFEQKNERSGNYSCPLCDNGMLVLRHNNKTGFPFYGCSNYPRCGYTESIDNKQPIKSYKNRNSEKITGESMLTYAEAWNKIVGYYEKYGTALEATIQTVWEDSVFSAILNYDTTEIDAQRAVQMGSTKKADIVVRKDGKDVIVAELKRHTEIVSGDKQEQLFSYLDRLKSANIGILVCNKLYIYDYDFTKRDEENKDNRLEIPFERDNPCGAKFVELFSKENFNVQSIKEYIRAKRKNAENSILILGEISETLVRSVLKNYFRERFSEEDVETALNKIDISVSMKNNQPYTLSSPTTKMHTYAEIKIKGYAFDLYMNPQKEDTIFQDFVQRTIADLLKWNLIPATEIEKLQHLDYSKETFGLQYALFQKDKNKCFDHTGKHRYWAKKIGMFYVCSQWWKEKVVPVYEDKFAEWLKYLSRISDNR